MKRSTIWEVSRLAFPATGEMALYMFIMFFDIMMIGKFGGKVAVSAAGLVYEIIYALAAIFIDTGVCVGITSLVARKTGAGQVREAEEYATIGLVLGALLSLFIFLCANYYCYGILFIAGAKGIVLIMGVSFMKKLSFAMLLKMFISTINGILRGCGNTKTPLKAAIVINIINLTLDYLLIAGNFGAPRLGITGAAVAAGLAQAVGFMYLVVFTYRKSLIKPRLSRILLVKFKKIKELLLLSIPSSLEEAAYSISRLVCLFMIMHTGIIAFSANHLANTVESISFMPGLGFGIAATTIVGLNVGEKNFRKARQSAYTCAFIGTFMMMLGAVLFIVWPNFLINLFVKDSETQVIKLGVQCLMIGAIEQPSIGISIIFAGCLKGYGDTKTPFLISLATSWLIRVPLIFWFIYINRVSVIYVWWITALQWTVDAILMFYFFKKRLKAYK